MKGQLCITFMTKYFANQFSSNNINTIYIDSPQWIDLTPEDLSSLSKTITHSFKYFQTPIDWIDGSEDIFLNVTLKAGILKIIIFDGAMGTSIQSYDLSLDDYEHKEGCSEILVKTKPEIIKEIHSLNLNL